MRAVVIFTACKRSLGQGNIFRTVLPPGGGVLPRGGGCFLGGCLVETPLPGMATAAGGTHPTGMHSCFLCCMSVHVCLV